MRLEIWVTFLDNDERTSRYLFTSQLSVDVNINGFLESKLQASKTVKLLSSSKIVNEVKTVLTNYKMSTANLVYFMSDNCFAMRGRDSGPVSLFRIQKIASISHNANVKELLSIPNLLVNMDQLFITLRPL